MSDQNRVPEPPIGRWIGFTLISTFGSLFMFVVLADSRNWPSTWPAWALALSILTIVFASLIHIEVTLLTSAIDIHEARRTRSPKPDKPRRLRGWLLVYAAIFFPLCPVYVVVTKQKSDGTMVIGWSLLALFFAVLWVALQIEHLVHHDPEAFNRALHNRRVQRVGVVSTTLVALFGSYAIFTPRCMRSKQRLCESSMATPSMCESTQGCAGFACPTLTLQKVWIPINRSSV